MGRQGRRRKREMIKALILNEISMKNLPLHKIRFTLHASRSSSGMTLIELLVVMVVMALIMSVSIPAFTSMGRGSGLRNAVSIVHTSLSLARQWAITHKDEISFSYFTASGSDASYFILTNRNGVAIQNEMELPMNVEFSANGSFKFKTDGGINPLTPSPIVIKDKETTMSKTITLYGLTGGIKVE